MSVSRILDMIKDGGWIVFILSY